MEGQPPVAVEPTNRWSRWFLRLTSAQTRRVALLLVLVATAAFGGLDTVDKQVTPFKSGEEFSDGEFTVTVERARLVDELKGTYGSAKPGKIYLGVVTTVHNDGTVPGRLRDQLDLRDVPQEEFFGAFRYRDGSAIQTLCPGLTEQLVFAWLLPDSAAQSRLCWPPSRAGTAPRVEGNSATTDRKAEAGSAPPHRKQRPTR